MKAVLVFLMLFATLGAKAQLLNSGEEFHRLVQLNQSQCPLLSCPSLSLQMRTLSTLEVIKLDSQTQKYLKMVADEMSQIWGDTILEADYYSDDETQIEQIQTLYQGSSLLGYRITYSAPAWDTSSCNFRTEETTSLLKCRSGKIIESAFVSVDFMRFFQDSFAPATFVIKQ